MQAIWSDCAVEQMVRLARIAGARLVLRIGQRACDLFHLVLRWRVVGRNGGTDLETPWIDRKRFGRRTGERGRAACARGARNTNPAPEQRAAIDKALAPTKWRTVAA